jgi:Na+/melibiose symporter-like transporter
MVSKQATINNDSYSLFKYGLMAFPLAFMGLPLYIHIPKLYHDQYGLSLSTLGIILFCSRISDALIDPLVGMVSDKFALRRKKYLIIFGILISITFNLFFLLPEGESKLFSLVWFSVCTFLSYLLYSLIYINYYSLGLELAASEASRIKLSGIREFCGFMGILLAAIIPSIFLYYLEDEQKAFIYYGLIFSLVMFVALYFIPSRKNFTKSRQIQNPSKKIVYIFSNQPLRWILLLFFVNTLPISITSNLFSFYVEEVLEGKNFTSFFLFCYFIFAALGAVLTLYASKFVNKIKILFFAMALSIISFSFIYFLDSSNVMWFFPICIVSGISLGAELAIFPSIAADRLHGKEEYGSIFFSIWGCLGKISLALAAGIFLPLISYSNQYLVDISASDKISFFYAIIPLLIKLITILMLSITIFKNRGFHANSN